MAQLLGALGIGGGTTAATGATAGGLTGAATGAGVGAGAGAGAGAGLGGALLGSELGAAGAASTGLAAAQGATALGAGSGVTSFLAPGVGAGPAAAFQAATAPSLFSQLAPVAAGALPGLSGSGEQPLPDVDFSDPQEALRPVAADLVAQGGGFFEGVGGNLKNIGTFAQEQPAAFVAQATNNFGLGPVGDALFANTPLAAKEVAGLTAKELADAKSVVGGVLGSVGGEGVPLGGQAEEPEQAPLSARRTFATPTPGQALAPPAERGEVAAQFVPDEATRQAQPVQARPTAAPAQSTIEFLDTLARGGDPAAERFLLRDDPSRRGFTDLSGIGGGIPIGTNPGEQGAAIRTQIARRRAGVPSEADQSNPVTRTILQALRSHPLGRLLPQQPLASFPQITEEQIGSAEFQQFLAATEGDPGARISAFATDTAALEALVSLPSSAFNKIIPRQGVTTGGGGAVIQQTSPSAFGQGGAQVIGRTGANQKLIGTGQSIALPGGGTGAIPRGRVILSNDPARNRQLVNSGAAIQLAPGVDENERVQLFDHIDQRPVNFTRADIALFGDDDNARFFGDPGTLVKGTIGGRNVSISRAAAAELSSQGIFDPGRPGGPTTNVNVTLRDPEARKRFKPNAAFLAGVSQAGKLLGDLDSLEFGVRSTGGVGKFAQFVSGAARQISADGGQFLLDVIAGGKDIDAARFAQHRFEMNNFAVNAMDAVIGQDVGTRVSDRDVELVQEAAGVIKVSSDREAVKGAFMGITAVRMVKNTIEMAALQRPSNFPVNTRKNAGKTFRRLVSKYKFNEDQAAALVTRLIEVEEQLEDIDFNVGGIVGQIAPGTFGLPDPFER